MSFKTIIETERLILRPFSMDDVDAYYDMNLDPEITRFTNDGGIKTKEEIEETIYNNVLGDYDRVGYGRFAVEWKKDHSLIGFSGLKYLPEYDLVDLGYRLKRSYWGLGIATETGRASVQFGFKQLELLKIVGFVLPQNPASIRVLEKLKFKYELDFIEDGILINQYFRLLED